MTSEFDAHAESYEADVERSISFAGQDHAFFMKLKTDALVDLARRHVAEPRELHVLDSGCGIGLAETFLASQVGRITGVDVSASAIARARYEQPAIEWVVQESAQLPFDDGAFDVSFASCVLHHVPVAERDGFMAEVARVTRPGGLVVIFEHNPLNPLTRVAVSRCSFDEDAVLLGRGEVATLMRRAGLAPAEQRYIVFFPWPGCLLRMTERALAQTPFGAQHYVAAKKPG